MGSLSKWRSARAPPLVLVREIVPAWYSSLRSSTRPRIVLLSMVCTSNVRVLITREKLSAETITLVILELLIIIANLLSIIIMFNIIAVSVHKQRQIAILR